MFGVLTSVFFHWCSWHLPEMEEESFCPTWACLKSKQTLHEQALQSHGIYRSNTINWVSFLTTSGKAIVWMCLGGRGTTQPDISYSWEKRTERKQARWYSSGTQSSHRPREQLKYSPQSDTFFQKARVNKLLGQVSCLERRIAMNITKI